MVQDTPYHQTVARENRCRSSHSNWPVRSLEQEVSTHPYVEAVSDRNLDRRLNIQIAPGDVSAQPGEFRPDGASRRLPRRRIPEHSAAIGLREPKSRTEAARQDRKTEQATIVIVHILPEACPSLCVLSRHAFKVNRGGIRENQPVPNDSDAVLRVGDLRIVGTDQARSLWDQKVVAGRLYRRHSP